MASRTHASSLALANSDVIEPLPAFFLAWRLRRPPRFLVYTLGVFLQTQPKLQMKATSFLA